MKARVRIGRSSKNLNFHKLVLQDVFHTHIYIIYIAITYNITSLMFFFLSFYMNSYALIATQSIIPVTHVVICLTN